MIHAEKARELTETALASLYEATLDFIERSIGKAAGEGYNYCTVQVHKNLVESITFILQNYDYAVRPIDTKIEQEVLKISW